MFPIMAPVGGMVNHRNYPIKSDNRFCRCKFTWDGPDYKDRHTCVNGVDVCIVCQKVSPYFARVCPKCESVFILMPIHRKYHGNYPECQSCLHIHEEVMPGFNTNPIRPKSIEELLDGL